MPLTHSLQVTGKLVTGNDVVSIEANPVASFPATLPFPVLNYLHFITLHVTFAAIGSVL